MTSGRTVVHRRSVIRTLEVCLFLVIACPLAAALDIDRTIKQFAHTVWGPKEGAPSIVTVLAQTTDGYLWLGSSDGLYRFDGVLFERYEPPSGEPFPARYVSSLLALPNGDLWIGFRFGGISLLRNGNATNYTVHQGVPDGRVLGLAQDREGTMWAATTGGLARMEGNGWKAVGKEWNFQGKIANAVFLDSQGTLWASTEDTLVFLPAGTKMFRPTGIRVGLVLRIAQAPSGKLWMAETTRSVRPVPLPDQRNPPEETEVQVGSAAILFAGDGALWIASLGDGLRRSTTPQALNKKIKQFGSEVESFTSKDGLSDDTVNSILQDREGNIWVGTSNGLDCFHKTNLVPVALPFKLRLSSILGAGDEGDIWVADQNSMLHVHGGQAEAVPGFGASALSAYRDPAGVIWWLGLDAIHRYAGGKYTTLPPPPGFPKLNAESMAATEDGSGTLWLAAQGEGLFYRKEGTWKRPDTPSELGELVPYAAFTDWMGRIWFGYGGGTIIILDHQQVQKLFRAEESGVGSVRTIGGRGRHTWVGGELGTAFFEGSRFRPIIPADAEAFGSVLGLEETSDGSLWLAESRGVIQIPPSEVQQALDKPSYRVKYRLFDSFDGLPGAFANDASSSRMIQGTDGRLWFATSGGIVWVDPANISTNSLRPSALIRSVKTNDRQFDLLANLVLPPRTTDLQISFTALSLSVPERVRFRYRLEGVDKEWHDAGTRREAFYTKLGPGQYHFQVIACNNDGVWNEEGANLDFNIPPTWYQTNWFSVACAGAFLTLMWGLYQLRVKQLRREFNVSLDARVDERTRIARELHDTLLQSLHGLMFEFQAARNMFQKRPEEALQALDGAILGTEQAITESQDAIEDLRSLATAEEDLTQLVKVTGEDLAASRSGDQESPTFGLTVEGRQRVLAPDIRNEVYRIAREVLRNAFRHSQAHRIEAEILYGEDQLRLRVRDDGIGMEPQVLEKGSRPGHWGLPGVRERAQQMGARLDFWSEIGAGTEVQLAVAASVAYGKRSGLSQFRLFQRTENHEHRP